MVIAELREMLSKIPNQQAAVTAKPNGDLIELNAGGHSIDVPYKGENRPIEAGLEALRAEGRLIILPVAIGAPIWVVNKHRDRFEVREETLKLEHVARFGNGSIYFSEEEAIDIVNILNNKEEVYE